jgi:hypothetical protein
MSVLKGYEGMLARLVDVGRHIFGAIAVQLWSRCCWECCSSDRTDVVLGRDLRSCLLLAKVDGLCL